MCERKSRSEERSPLWPVSRACLIKGSGRVLDDRALSLILKHSNYKTGFLKKVNQNLRGGGGGPAAAPSSGFATGRTSTAYRHFAYDVT